MARYQIVCVVKPGGHYNPHERITSVGVSAGERFTQQQVIAAIESRRESFYVSQAGRTVDVIVAVHNGHKYIKTVTDGVQPDNLLALRDC